MSLASSPDSLASPALPATPPALAAAQELEVVTAEDALEESPLSGAQRVRFDADCVLIPDPSPVSRLPWLVTKSYALPLWRKRNMSLEYSLSESEADARDDEHVVLKVSVPSIAIRTRSPSRSEQQHQPLVPCLVNNHQHHVGPTSPDLASPSPAQAHAPRRPARAASVSSSPPIPNAHIITIPLRPCCADCARSMEACFMQGADWQEHFTRGALRLRRRASLSDANCTYGSHRKVCESLPGFSSVVSNLAVDEVDKVGKGMPTRVPTLPVAEVLYEEEADNTLLPSLSRTAFTSRNPHAGRHPAAATSSHSKAYSVGSNCRTYLPDFAPVDENLASSLATLDHGGSRTRSVKALGSSGALSRGSPSSVASTATKTMASRAVSPPQSARNMTASPEPLPYSLSTPVSTPLKSQSSFDEILDSSPRNLRRPPLGPRRSHIHMPAPSTFFKASAEFLKGVSLSAGTPMSL